MARKIIRQWRVAAASPSGLQVWFDPETEFLRLYDLEPPDSPGVADACEGDDQEGLAAPDQVTFVAELSDDLPF